jgi:hypothetical protein
MDSCGVEDNITVNVSGKENREKETGARVGERRKSGPTGVILAT